VGQSAQRVGEADPLDCDFLTYGGCVHHRADQVVDQGEHREFLENALDCLTVQDVHLHRLLEMAEIGFDLPALPIEIGQFRSRIEVRVEQIGHQCYLLRTTATLVNIIAQFAES
jgi:hypothetical protein